MNRPEGPAEFSPTDISYEKAMDIIVFLGPDGVLLDVNPRFEKVTGRARDDVIGRPVSR